MRSELLLAQVTLRQFPLLTVENKKKKSQIAVTSPFEISQRRKFGMFRRFGLSCNDGVAESHGYTLGAGHGKYVSL
jgi:hypothetical protein